MAFEIEHEMQITDSFNHSYMQPFMISINFIQTLT
ncbi:MAG: hypothetical protein H6Q23_1998 [Bacteroidetes bacterium]|jgi:hypothetical protein|nr:hypothetical protein [Bacteroidota bacterium]